MIFKLKNIILIFFVTQLYYGCKSDQKVSNGNIDKINLSDSVLALKNEIEKTNKSSNESDLKKVNLRKSLEGLSFSNSNINILFTKKDNRIIGEIKGDLNKDEGAVVYIDAIIDSIIILDNQKFKCILLPHEFLNTKNHNESVGGLNEYTKLVGTIIDNGKLSLKDNYGEYDLVLDLKK